jgi:adenylate cyclase
MTEERDKWIVAVDDDAGLLDSFKRILARKYRVSLFSTPAEALETIRAEGCPDLVITDQRMPIMKGTQLLEEILKLYPESVGMIVTGFTEKGDLIGAINNARVFAYVVKPWAAEDLLETVDRALRMSSARRAKKNLNEDLAKIQQRLGVLKSTISADKATLAESFDEVRRQLVELSERSARLEATEKSLKTRS